MKKLFTISIVTSTLLFSTSIAFSIETPKNGPVFFQENKGQICDQNFKPRTDVLYSGVSNGMVYHLTQKGVSYQLSKIDSWKEVNGKAPSSKVKVPESSTIYRVDINWTGINQNAVITPGEVLEGVSNYYLPQCENGVLNVKSYSQLTYANIYNGIDLKWYENNGELEYDFILKPNANPNQIQFEIKGAEKLSINKNGELEIKTPLGLIVEKAPVAFQNNNVIEAEWQLTNNKIGFRIANYNKNSVLIIDPAIRSWGTYYGSTGIEIAQGSVSDASGSNYLAGYTSITSTVIATVGAHQTVYGGSTADGFVSKFNSSGVRQWATFYGGGGSDIFYEIDADFSGNVYAVGESYSSSGIYSTGAHQTYGGGADAMAVKFNSSGVRQWGTYYGTSNADYGRACAVDNAGNLYLAGYCNSGGTVIATPGSHQPANGGLGFYDGFLVKFNTAGVRQWGTFYGGGADDYAYGVASTSAGDVYISGQTTSTNNIASVGSHQATKSGGNEAFIAKFNTSGVRQWGTYYGNTGSDIGNDCAVDPTGNAYLTGSTTSSISIATVGAAQATYGGVMDAFLVKFNSTGVRQWCSYYGGTSTDIGWSCSVNSTSEVFIGGTTASTLGISTPGTHQIAYGGGSADGYITKLSSAGVLQYSTYYGGSGTDEGYSIDAKNLNTIYLAGTSTSANGISTPGSHQSVFGGSYDAYLVKFMDCANLSLSITGNSSICNGQTTTLTASGAGFTSYSWTPTSITTAAAVLNPTTTTTYTVLAGTSTVGCTYPLIHTLTVNPIPTITVSDNHPGGQRCPGFTYTLTAYNVGTYTWSTGANTQSIVVSPTVPTSYSVTGISAAGCAAVNTATSYPYTMLAKPTVNISTGTPTICSGSNATLTASGASTYTWSTGGTGTSISVSPTVTAIYTATGTAVSGCTNTKTLSLNVVTAPTVSVNNYTICSGGTATLIATGATTYSWNTSATTSSILVTPAITTNYTVTGTNGGVCSNTRTLSVTVGSALSILITPSTPTICVGNSGTITASGATSYTWNTGSNATSIVISPTTTTNYTVTGTSGSCNGTNTISIAVSANPTVAAVSSSSLICTGSSATLSATGATSYNWNPGSLSGTSVVVSPTTSVTYTVVGSNAAGCTNTRTVSITVSACTGINEALVVNGVINIYPNPNNGEFTLVVPEVGMYMIVNSIGQTIETIEVNENAQTISVQGLADGIYYVIGKSAKAKIVVSK